MCQLVHELLLFRKPVVPLDCGKYAENVRDLEICLLLAYLESAVNTENS